MRHIIGFGEGRTEGRGRVRERAGEREGRGGRGERKRGVVGGVGFGGAPEVFETGFVESHGALLLFGGGGGSGGVS